MSETILQIIRPATMIQIGAPGPQGIPGSGVSSVDWSAITGKPLTFTPDDHTHPVLEVDGLTELLALKADGDAVDAQFASMAIDISGKADLIHTQAISTVTGLQAALDLKAPLDNPTLTRAQIAMGTLTADTQGINLSATYSNAAVTFGGLIKVAVTDTASNASSLLMDLGVISANKFTVEKSNRINFWVGATNRCGIVSADGFALDFYQNTNKVGTLNNGGNFNCTSFSSNGDTYWLRGGSGVWQMYNNANPQSVEIFGTRTNGGVDYVRGAIRATTTAFTIAAESAGTGSANLDIVLTPKGTGGIKFGSSKVIDPYGGTFAFGVSGFGQFESDGGYRIGNGQYGMFIGTGIQLPSTSSVSFSSTTNATVTNDTVIKRGGGAGIVTLLNATTGFDRLQFGGTTSSFPALKRRNATIECRLADDTAIATFVGAMVRKAGAVSDADFTNPVDGCQGFDTVNKKHYIREGGVWYSSPAYT